MEEKVTDMEQQSKVEKVEATDGAQLFEQLCKQVAKETGLAISRVKAAAALRDEGNTIPFIARYRKEMTGELDETELRDIEERLQYLRNLEDRKQEVLRLIDKQDKLTPELAVAIEEHAAAWDRKARHAAYDKLVAAYRSSVSEDFDPTNPANRKFMDDANGAINRREVAEKEFDQEWRAFQQFMNSRRGRVARRFADFDEAQ